MKLGGQGQPHLVITSDAACVYQVVAIRNAPEICAGMEYSAQARLKDMETNPKIGRKRSGGNCV